MTVILVDPSTTVGVAIGTKAVVLYAVVIIGILSSLIWKSEMALYELIFLLPLQTTRSHLHGLPLGSNIVDLLLLSCLIGSILRPQKPAIPFSGVLRYLFFMGIFYYLSLWRGGFFLGKSLPLWFNDPRLVDYKNFMVMPLLTLAAVLTLRTKKQFAFVVLLCCLTSILVDYSYFKSSSGRDFTHYSEETRDAGPLGYAGENGLASYTVEITLCLLPLLALPGLGLKRLALLAVIAANTWCLLFSYSREAYLALAVGLLLLAALRLRWLLVPLLLLAFTWQALLPTAVRERISMTYVPEDSGTAAKLDASAQERLDLWNDAMVLVRENPVFGTGFLTYAYMHRVGLYRDTHNFYLKMLVETGLPGLLLFILQLSLFMREGWLLFRRAADPFLSLLGLGFFALVLSAAVVNIFGDRWLYIQVDSNLWILLGCTLCASSLAASDDSLTAMSLRRNRPEFLHEGDAFLPAQTELNDVVIGSTV